MKPLKRNSTYYWERVNALRHSIVQLDGMSKSFRTPGSEGAVRCTMASALLHDALCASFTQAIEMYAPHSGDKETVRNALVVSAKAALKEVLRQSVELEAETIDWDDVVGKKVYDPYGTEEGEKDG